jgi:hypothetical protein
MGSSAESLRRSEPKRSRHVSRLASREQHVGNRDPARESYKALWRRQRRFIELTLKMTGGP